MKKHNVRPRKRRQKNQMKLDKTLNTVVNIITTAQKDSDKVYNGFRGEEDKV